MSAKQTIAMFARLKQHDAAMQKKIDALKAENSRLRKTLQRLSVYDPCETDYRIHCQMRKIASGALLQALEGKP